MIEQVVSKPQIRILNSVRHINLFLAGVGSGKTHLGGIKSYQLIRKYPLVRGFIGANTYLQLTQSTLFRIREYWKSIGVTEFDKVVNPGGQYVVNKKPPSHFKTETHNFDNYYGIISFKNDCVIFTGSMDRADVHSGKEFGWAILDEVKDTDESDIKEYILTRLRQRGIYIRDGKLSDSGEPFNPIYFLTSPAKEQWLNDWFELDKWIDEISSLIYSDKTYFFKEFGDKCVTISSTYHNQVNLPENYIGDLLANNSEERGKALVYGNPFATTGGEFYSSFNRLKHVSSVKYDPELPIHISFDQNSVPYNSAGIAQVVRIKDIWEWRWVDEIALPNPRNSTEEVCDEFMMRYPKHKSGLFYYGDASGHNRSTMNKDFSHHYEVIEFKLRKYLVNGSDRTLVSNPSVVLRRDFINRMFEDKLPIRVIIDESCHHLINDLMYCKQALDGGKDKHIVNDKETGEKYQKYGHFGDLCFTGDTLIRTDKGYKTILSIRVGDKVLTRNGFKKVTACINKGLQLVDTYQIGNKRITCTPDHRIFANGEFIIASALINKNIIAIFEEKISWIDRLLFTMGINSINTQMPNVPQIGIITKDGLRNQAFGGKGVCIFINTRKKLAKFQRDMQSIILMAISKTTILKTICVCYVENMFSCITKIVHRSIRIMAEKDYLNWLFLKLSNGTNQRQAGNGIERIQQGLFIQKNILQYALIVEKSSNRTYEINQSIVQENANSNIKREDIEQKENITKTGYVQNVGRYFQLIDGIKLYSALSSVRRIRESNRSFVYDITVEQEHEFFANGILVHNCEYMAVELFRNYYNG